VRENFELVDLDVEWRYVGMIQNGHGDVDNMVKLAMAPNANSYLEPLRCPMATIA
jgi:hypothetical protein